MLTVGLLLSVIDLVMIAHGAPPNIGLLSMINFRSSAMQAGIFLMLNGLYQFVLGVKVDGACQKAKTSSNEEELI